MQRTDITPTQSPALAALINNDYELNFQEFMDQIQLANKPMSLLPFGSYWITSS
ncbi:hypothetical protein VCRA2113O118_10104 [Vibrio crassostreae]|uniref:Uncharacterized protein n=1 Tax=Vibrio crassostreae TaxID=246167 RepID=A0A822MTT0_9VIBR|nr:hypothetical protein [Vibrio crassostreae]CAK1856366.1 hypothetical protein VCRA2110O113_10104 [Vibrio crassostreae]CAK1864877.1 hypothetical protein VCRA2113O120_10295 [Vibrio crassostreae]CAK1869411.1 hypothetical protein VCRA2114E123_10303 [Vibrio crassostreae]CAK1871696.1 hypothetical protein VCRA2114E122_10303 [Vibrio crassostreae]CAK2061046.1 hypothetical protein VCRA2113O119_30103 [Vibrio crassostreae]